MPQYNCPECGSGNTEYLGDYFRQCVICRHAAIQEAFEDNSAAILLDNRELATVLAALRYWQRDRLSKLKCLVVPEDDMADNGAEVDPLSAEEIDTLCERINI